MAKFYPTYFTKTENGLPWAGYSDLEAQRINDIFNSTDKSSLVQIFKKITDLSKEITNTITKSKLDSVARQYLANTLSAENPFIYSIYIEATRGGFQRIVDIKAYNSHVCITSSPAYVRVPSSDSDYGHIPKVTLYIFTTRSNRGGWNLNADFISRNEEYCQALIDLHQRATDIISTIDDKMKFAQLDEKERKRKELARQLEKLNEELGYDG